MLRVMGRVGVFYFSYFELFSKKKVGNLFLISNERTTVTPNFFRLLIFDLVYFGEQESVLIENEQNFIVSRLEHRDRQNQAR